jgi:NitT/TauT family transport system permease protein
VVRPAGSRWSWAFLIDIAVFLFVLAAIFGVYSIGRAWLGPPLPQTQISQSPSALPLYALYSLVRIAVAYALSLVFALGYGYVAANSRRAELILVPLLDILQSIPVLSFLPGVMLAMVAIFPHRQLGVELGSILLIFTGQVWNIAFSFYSSLKTEPRELKEAARIYRFGRWQRFVELDLPFATIGLVWNSMMSVAGGWFFLMACEMFVLGKRDFRLPGLGSYLQTAASADNTPAILNGVAALVIVIVLMDQLVWRPVIAWAEKFKFENVESADSPRSSILNFLRRSSALAFLSKRSVRPIEEAFTLYFAKRAVEKGAHIPPAATRKWFLVLLGTAGAAGIIYAIFRSGALLAGLNHSELKSMLLGAGATFLRVTLCLLIGTLWTVPAGVAIGTHPKLARVAQPLAQIAASVPATALFPIVLLALVRVGGGLGIGSVLLLLLGTQWYILFNVIAGASAMPTDLKEVCRLFRFSRFERWRKLILPAIFPYLITGLVTASGGAWNASIVAEYFHLHGKIYSTAGLGALISQATDDGNSRLLLAATICMAAIVALVNRMVWRRLYRLAATRFKLET